MKTEQARERLQLNQTRNEPLALGANREIDHVKIRVFRFIWNFQCLWHGRCRVPCELLRARESDNLIRRACDFICELERQKNGRFGDAKIRRPFFGFIHAAHQRVVFVRREVGVEGRAKFRIHVTICPAA